MAGPVAILYRLGLASVPGFAPVGASAASYARHCWGPSPLPEVLAHHAENWPGVGAEKEFAPHLQVQHLDAGALIALARDATGGRGRVGIEISDRIPVLLWVTDRLANSAHEARFPWVPGGLAGFAKDSLVLADQLAAAPPPRRRWLLHRSLGPGLGWNRAETATDLLDAAGLLDVLTAVAARGGGLLLDVPLRPDGTVPEAHAEVLRAAGSWLGRHADAFADTEPFDVWGDDEVRYLARPADREGFREIFLFDLRRQPSRTIGHFSPHRYPIESVVALQGQVGWQQDAGGLHLSFGDTPPDAVPGSDATLCLPTVVRITVRDRRLVRLPVHGQRTPGRVAIGPRAYGSIGEALAQARPGEVVSVSAGRSGRDHEQFPLVVPAGVTLRGASAGAPDEAAPLGVAAPDDGTVLDLAGLEPDVPAVRLAGEGAAVEHLTVDRPPVVSGGLLHPWVAIVVEAAHRARIEHCVAVGDIHVDGTPEATVAWNTVRLGSISLTASDAAVVRGNHQRGTRQWSGIVVRGGAGLRIDANHLDDNRHGIHLRGVSDSVVTGNDIHGTWEAVHLGDCTGVHVVANRLRGMRAMTVAGGRGNVLATNVADHTDTAVLLDHGAAGTEVEGNRFEGCRVEVLAWDHEGTVLRGNRADGTRERAVVDPSGSLGV